MGGAGVIGGVNVDYKAEKWDVRVRRESGVPRQEVEDLGILEVNVVPKST